MTLIETKLNKRSFKIQLIKSISLQYIINLTDYKMLRAFENLYFEPIFFLLECFLQSTQLLK